MEAERIEKEIIKDCHNTTTIFDTRKYVLLEDYERLQQQLKRKKAEKLLFDRIKETEINVLKEELKSAQELIGDIQASWEQFGALTSELEERINKIKNV